MRSRRLPAGFRPLLGLLGCASLLALPAYGEGGLPDLVTRLDKVVYEDGAVLVEGAVRNAGDASYAGGDAVKFHTTGGSARYLSMPALPPGTEYRFSLTLPGSGPQIELTVQADPLDRVTEYKESNNKVRRRVGRLADLAVASMQAESEPAPGSTAHLLADVRDLAAGLTGSTPPTSVEVQTRAVLRAPDGSQLDLLANRRVVPGFSGQHYLPVDVPLPSDAALRLGSSQGDLRVEVCIDPRDQIMESGEQCPQDQPGCNNCYTHVFQALDLGPVEVEEPEPEPVAEVAPLPEPDPEPEVAPLPEPEPEPVVEQPEPEPEPSPDLLAPDLVIAGATLEPAVVGLGNQLVVDLQLLRGSLEGSQGSIQVEVHHRGWRFDDHSSAPVELAQLADDGQATVTLDLVPRATPGRCGPTMADSTVEIFELSLGAPMAEDLAGFDGNNSRRLPLRLACHTAETAIGLGPMPDPALAAVEPYVVREDSQDYLRFMVSLHNLGTPVHSEALQLHAAVEPRSWLPTSWQAGADATYTLDAVIDEPLNGLPPRRLHLCGLGGRAFPLDDLPDFAHQQRGRRPVGTDNSVELSLSFEPTTSIRQLRTDNDSLTVIVPLDRDLRPAAQTACGGAPLHDGLEPERVRSLDPEHPVRTNGAVAATLESETLPDGRIELRGQLIARSPGALDAVAYRWLRDGQWAGEGVVDVPADAPATVIMRELPDSPATWTLVADPMGQLQGDDRHDNEARLRLR